MSFRTKRSRQFQKILRAPIAALIFVLFFAVGAAFSSCSLVSNATEDSFDFCLSQTEITLEEGGEAWLHLIKTPADGKKIPLVWRTANEEIATVRGGKITAVSPGETYAEVQTNEETFSCRVTVTPRTPDR